MLIQRSKNVQKRHSLKYEALLKNDTKDVSVDFYFVLNSFFRIFRCYRCFCERRCWIPTCPSSFDESYSFQRFWYDFFLSGSNNKEVADLPRKILWNRSWKVSMVGIYVHSLNVFHNSGWTFCDFRHFSSRGNR